LDAVDETAVQEFVAGLKRATFKLTKRNGSLIKTYKLSRKTILNVVGVVKLVLGKKIWMTWELDFGEAGSPRATLFHRTTVEKDYRIRVIVIFPLVHPDPFALKFLTASCLDSKARLISAFPVLRDTIPRNSVKDRTLSQ